MDGGIDVFAFYGKHVELTLKNGEKVTGWARYCSRALDTDEEDDAISIFATTEARSGRGYYANEIKSIRVL